MSLRLKKLNKCDAGESEVMITNTSDIEKHSGSDVIAVLVLRGDGNIDVYPQHDLTLRNESGDGELKSKSQDGQLDPPGVPLEHLHNGHKVKVSHIVTMVGSPGCICVNGTRYRW